MKTIVVLKKTFEEIEALTFVDYLRRAGIDVKMVSMEKELFVEGGHGIVVKADILFDDLENKNIDLLYIPGGMPAAKNLRDDQRLIDLISYLNKRGKIIASICAGPMTLGRAGVVEDKEITSYPGFDSKIENLGIYSQDAVVVSENIVTSRGPATAVLLAMELIELLCGKKKRKDIEDEILLSFTRS